MISHVNYFNVGKAEDIRRSGWVKVYLMGWEVMVLPFDNGFFAIEIGELASHSLKSFLPDDSSFTRPSVKGLIDKMLLGPAGTVWGKLRHFPVRIEDDFVLVGVISRI
ncbi:MAG: hypothetical protein A2W25_13700 [candidate division Zixibacteria bacterium RBG_16_53_22]|nr:MAG: hypothetical protein A2W25_13700 [candidate division Zixibacteria bacterium RBG_16_53_22]